MNRNTSIYLAIIFFLAVLVICLTALLGVMLIKREGPLLALPQRSAPIMMSAPTLAAPPPPPPTSRIVLTIGLPEPPLELSPRTPAGGDSLSLPTRVVAVVTSTPTVVTNTPVALPPTPAPPTATPGPSPTPTYPDTIRFVLDGDIVPDKNRGCLGGAVYGTIRDAQGNPVEGLRVKVYNEYVTDYSAPSKSVSAPDAGFYDFIINPKSQTWNVVVVDGANNPISPEAEVVRPDGMDVCYFQVNWKGTG